MTEGPRPAPAPADPAPVQPNGRKPARDHRKLVEAMEAKHAAELDSLTSRRMAALALNDRNVLVAALLAQRGTPLTLANSAVEAAAKRAHLVVYERTTALIAEPAAERGLIAALRRLFRAAPRVAPAPSLGAEPVTAEVLRIRWANQAEEQRLEEQRAKANRAPGGPPPETAPPPDRPAAEAPRTAGT